MSTSFELRRGVIKAYSIKRMPTEMCWDASTVEGVQGAPWRPAPLKRSTRTPTYIREEMQPDEEEPEEPIQGIDREELEEPVAPQPPEPKVRAFSAPREDMMRHGATDKCRGCTAIARNWERCFAHWTTCRERIMARILEDGDKDGRMNTDTEKMPKASAIDVELSQLFAEKMHVGKRGIRERYHVARERNILALMGKNLSSEIASLVWSHTKDEIRQDDLRSNALERALRTNQRCHTYFQNEMGKGMPQEIAKRDIAGIHSPTRVTSFANEFGLQPGWGLDLTCCEDRGQAWDFTKPEMRKKARELAEKYTPMLLIGSPVSPMHISMCLSLS